MRGDFTKDSFDRAKHFSRVLKQQGRVTLDADDNEQAAILLHYLRTLARDLIGPYSAPLEGGLRLQVVNGSLQLSPGRCYVDGLLVENEEAFAVPDDWKQQPASWRFVFLDVWEQHITPLDDDSIREKALGGPDTCTRTKVVWQVREYGVNPADLPLPTKPKDLISAGEKQIMGLVRTHVPNLTARLDPGRKDKNPCVVSPDSKFRGMENQLYRVEIHQGGKAGDPIPPTLKWSPDNGSVAAAWLSTSGNELQLSSCRGFAAGNWVELLDEQSELRGTPGVLVRVTKVDGDTLSVEVESGTTIPSFPPAEKPRVRRWDHVRTETSAWDRGALQVIEDGWIDLEDGLQVKFTPGGDYRTGDYWLIPARVATGTIEWPEGSVEPPRGVEHHHAALAFVLTGAAVELRSCAPIFTPLDE